MRILFILLFIFSLSHANDATIEVIKKVESLPTLAVEDSSVSYDDTFRLKFFKALVADLNVISLFNVDRHHRQTHFNDSAVMVDNKDMDYVLRYKMFEDDDGALNIDLKLIHKENIALNKKYRISRKNVFMFVSHTIAYDINEFMGAPSVEWMKRRVIFSRVVAPQKTEVVISDYTLAYQHTVVKGGFNIFPKWANNAQNAFYYTSLDEKKPTLKYVDIKTGKSKAIISSDGMMICSDVSRNGKKLLLTMAPKGQPDVYLYDVDTFKTQQLTTYGGIDVNAQFMDSETIVFISGRLGYPNVFSKKIGSNSVEQMVYYGKSNSACSTHGEYIVYKARESSNAFSTNTFNLHLISTKTDFIRRLTATGVNEFPRFSIDGDAILFIKNYKAQSSIGIIRLNHNKNYLFPLKYGKLQAMDW
ncbi:translocation protein TolB [Sulfurimonas gotlandica GD1]|uniref:Translocation protein TolB n=1 Tax=Sulfurimonas gotlandica (strain DSM 19862 / JCM 16533 / GD1) TaxID=929558 RepID=B6BMT1_SULGG|nr:Tol-Pal system protein TolB [Sulfurimonas gotlandica]EDZ61544.1 protein TolB [Sulfurimonas gotlandica GD1]EHP30800.1 translocation protein TolB [Sulfurimonas gotlandica GD1]